MTGTTNAPPADSTARRMSSNTAFTMVARVVYMVTRLFVPPFVLARVGLEAYGIWSTAFLLVGYLGVTTLGVSNVYIKFIAEYNARREYTKANQLLSTGLMLTIPVCLALFWGVESIWPRIASQFQISPHLAEDARSTVLLVTAIFLSSIGLCAFADALAGLQQIVLLQKISMLSFLVETALIYILVGFGRGIRGMAEAFLARQILMVVLSGWALYRTTPWLRLSFSGWSRDAVRLLLRYGGVVQFQSLLTTFLGSAERFLGASMIGAESAGLMDLAKKWPASVSSIPSSILTALLPAASHTQATASDNREIQRLYLASSKYLHLTFAAFGGFLCLLAEPICRVWLGRDLADLAPLMIVMTLTFQIHMLTGAGTSLMSGLGKPGEALIYCVAHLIALGVCYGGAILLLPALTSFTIGCVVSLANVLAALFYIHRTNRLLGIPSSQYLQEAGLAGILPYLAAAPFGFAASSLLSHQDRWTGLVILAGLGTAYMAVLAPAVYRLILDSHARHLVRAALARVIARNESESPA
jgi:O-antigen/teichoic acid export membrane protein